MAAQHAAKRRLLCHEICEQKLAGASCIRSRVIKLNNVAVAA